MCTHDLLPDKLVPTDWSGQPLLMPVLRQTGPLLCGFILHTHTPWPGNGEHHPILAQREDSGEAREMWLLLQYCELSGSISPLGIAYGGA